jgi:alpha-beta hydrolase superfamily lysophospholipase
VSHIPIRRTELSDVAADGLAIFRRSWLPQEAERHVVLVHGFAEHSGRYEHVGAWLASRGCAVHGYDHRGHGRSEGRRGHVARFGDYLDDLSKMLESVVGSAEGLPVHLVGHSMGGLITAAFLRERSAPVSSAVLSAAALALPPSTSRFRMIAARVMRRVAPTLGVQSPVDPDGLSRDPEVVRAYETDPFVEHEHMTASLAAELLSAIERTHARGIETPVLVLHGDSDPICPIGGSERFASELPRGHFVSYPGLRHEIFNEPERETVFKDLLEWIESSEGRA